MLFEKVLIFAHEIFLGVAIVGYLVKVIYTIWMNGIDAAETPFTVYVVLLIYAFVVDIHRRIAE